MIGFKKWSHKYGIREYDAYKFKTSVLSRPTSAARTKLKIHSDSIPSIFNSYSTLQPYTSNFSSFKEQSFSNQDLFLLLRDHKAEEYTEGASKYSKPTIFLNKKNPTRPQKQNVSRSDPWLDRVKSIMYPPPSSLKNMTTQTFESSEKTFKSKFPEEKPRRPNKSITTPSRFQHRKASHNFYPPNTQPFKGKLTKDSQHFGVKFSPKSDALATEQTLSIKAHRLSLNRVHSKSRR